jgi:Flp pilus assembly protein TadB
VAGDGNGEEDKDRHDRELMELLNELRVALPGVQVLFAFLLTVAFSQRFVSLSATQENVYFVAVLCSAAATAFLIAPSAFHRIQFREGDKEWLVQFSNRLALAGLFFLACAVCCVLYVISDFVVGGSITVVSTAGGIVLFAVLWLVLPLLRKARS